MSTRLRARIAVPTMLSALVLSSLAMVAPATTAAAASSHHSCPASFPQDDLIKGQEISGLTTTDGTAPEAFTGEFVNVLEGGIDAKTDLLVFKFKGSRITHADGSVDMGIWAGMSGSPVYSADDRLIGAVSYSFSYGPSLYAGVTPAEALYAVKDGGTSRLSANGAIKAKPSSRETKELVDAGMPRSTANQGARKLEVPRYVTGGSSATVKKVNRAAKKAGVPMDALPRAGVGHSSTLSASDIVPGGNIGTSWSSGAVGLVSIGTVTAVCGDDVYAFGHPSEWAGDETLESIHPASATHIDGDPASGSYKLANVGPAVGKLLQDRSAGVFGRLGAAHPSTPVTTKTKLSTGPNRSATSHVTEPLALSYVLMFQTALETTLATDRIGAIDAKLSWSFDVERSKKFHRKVVTHKGADRYSAQSSDGDLAWRAAVELDEIVYQPFENVRIKSVSLTNRLDTKYKELAIDKVKIKRAGRWSTVEDGDTVRVKAGSRIRVRTYLVRANKYSKAKNERVERVLRIPKRAAGARGEIVVFGGSSFYFDEDGDYDEDFEDVKVGRRYRTIAKQLRAVTSSDIDYPGDLPELLELLRAVPRGDRVFTSYDLHTASKLYSNRVDAMVGGMVSIGLRGR